MAVSKTTRPPVGSGRRFLEHAALISDTEECILWPYGLTRKGYGQAYYEGKNRIAHQLVLELSGSVRPEPPNDFALHSCDVRSCVNPKHLSWGTALENTAQMIERGRDNFARMVS